jgi:hypothetical protein
VLVWSGGGCRTFALCTGEALHPETRNGAVGNGREKSRQVGDSTSDRFTADTAALDDWAEAVIEAASRAKTAR